jgi:hypothetical protein
MSDCSLPGVNQIGACDFAGMCAILRGYEESQEDH